MLFDPEEECCVPRVESRDGVVALDLLGVLVHVAVLDIHYQSLENHTDFKIDFKILKARLYLYQLSVKHMPTTTIKGSFDENSTSI